VIELTDSYGNAITDTPNAGVDPIVRRVGIDMDITNEVRLDQHNNLGTDSAVEIGSNLIST
jgi:hypothetical protein